MLEYRVTNVVLKSVLVTTNPLDLSTLANRLNNVIYNPQQFSALRLKNKKIGGSMLLFANGYAVCHGPATSHYEARRRVRRYARLVQKAGYEGLRVTASQILTITLAADVGHALNLNDVCTLMTGSTYEPELHNALMHRTRRAHFNVFSTGKVVVTGVRKFSHIMSDVIPTLIEMSIA